MKYLLTVLILQMTFTNSLHNSNNSIPLDSSHQPRNIILSGNVLSNQLTGNRNTTIINKKDHTINSNNTDHSTVLNRNSYNKVSTIKKSGNINKQVNKGEISIGNRQDGRFLPLNPHSNPSLFRMNLKDIMHGSLYQKNEKNFNKAIDLKNLHNNIESHLKKN